MKTVINAIDRAMVSTSKVWNYFALPKISFFEWAVLVAIGQNFDYLQNHYKFDSFGLWWWVTASICALFFCTFCGIEYAITYAIDSYIKKNVEDK